MGLGVKPSESHNTALSIFEEYPSQVSRISGGEKKQIKRTAKALFQTSPSDAISYLSSQRGYTNWRPDKSIANLMAKPVNYDKFRSVGTTAFQDLLGRNMSDAEWQQTSDYARTMGVKDPSAFQQLVTTRLASTPEGQAKIKSQSDIEWESQYGTMPRDEQGNLVRGMVRYNPSQVTGMINSMFA